MTVKTLYDILDEGDFESDVIVDGKTIDRVIAVFRGDTELPTIEIFTKEKTGTVRN